MRRGVVAIWAFSYYAVSSTFKVLSAVFTISKALLLKGEVSPLSF